MNSQRMWNTDQAEALGANMPYVIQSNGRMFNVDKLLRNGNHNIAEATRSYSTLMKVSGLYRTEVYRKIQTTDFSLGEQVNVFEVLPYIKS